MLFVHAPWRAYRGTRGDQAYVAGHKLVENDGLGELLNREL